MRRSTHLLLFHKLRVGAVVDDVLAKHRRAQRGVDLLGVDVLDLAVENEVVALGVEAHGHLAPEQDEGEDVAVLLLVGEEELVRVHAVCDGAADDGQPVEHDGRLIGLLEQELLQHVEHHGQEDKGGEPGGDEDGQRRGGGEVAQWAGDGGEDTHSVRRRRVKGLSGGGGVVEGAALDIFYNRTRANRSRGRPR
jgi:hypothetical protein